MMKDKSEPCERPDIEYQGLKIDLSLKEWVIVGVIVVVVAFLLR